MIDPVWWHKFNHVADASEIGPAITGVGTPTETAGKFDGALYSTNAANYLKLLAFPSALVNNWQKYTLVMQIHSDWSVSSGDPSGTGWPCALWVTNGSKQIDWVFFDSTYGFGIETPGAQFYNKNAGITWNAGTTHQIALVVDKDGINGTAHTVEMYIDHVLCGSSSMVPGAITGDVTVFFLNGSAGSTYVFKGWKDNPMLFNYALTAAQLATLDSQETYVEFVNQLIFDNLMISNFAKLIFTDRFWEDELGVPFNFQASPGLFTDKVALSWSPLTRGILGNLKYPVYRDDVLLAEGIIPSYNDLTATPGVKHNYKLRSVTDAADSAYTPIEIGYIIYSSVYRTIRKKKPVDGKPHIYLINESIDLLDLGVTGEVLNVVEEKTFERDKIISNEIQIVCKNYDDWLSIDNPKSVFRAYPWKYAPVFIYDDEGNLIWDGVIVDIIRNHQDKTVTIVSQDVLAQFRNSPVVYTSADWETPADAAKNILAASSIPYDASSFGKSSQGYTDAGCLIKVTYAATDNIRIIAALEAIANVGVADCFSLSNKVFFVLPRPFDGRKIVKKVIDADLVDPQPEISFTQTEIKNEYSVRYEGDGGVPATDANSFNIGAASRNLYGTQQGLSHDGSAGQIVIKDKVSATFLGETMIKRTHYSLKINPRPIQQVTLALRHDFKHFMDIISYFRFTFSPEAWDEKLLEAFRVERNDDEKKITILALEVEE